jgi:hypothetical protein
MNLANICWKYSMQIVLDTFRFIGASEGKYYGDFGVHVLKKGGDFDWILRAQHFWVKENSG